MKVNVQKLFASERTRRQMGWLVIALVDTMVLLDVGRWVDGV